MSEEDLSPLRFIGSSRKDLQKFPKTVRYDVGFDLYEVQRGKTPHTAKPLKGLPGVMELVERYATDTYRAVYVANLGNTVYVLHCFKKKAKHSIKTPREDMNIIKRRFRLAMENFKKEVLTK